MTIIPGILLPLPASLGEDKGAPPMDKAAPSKIPELQVRVRIFFEDGTLEENLEKLAAVQNLKLQAEGVAYDLTVVAFTPEQPLWETLWHLMKLTDFEWMKKDDVLTLRQN